jgi:putative DNA primase/helicase
MPRDVEDRVRANGYAPEIEDVCAADVPTRSVEWFWRGRVPKGKLTMFDGDPDLGKSVVTMDIAARKSAGRTFPDGAPCEAGNVLIVNVEDGADDTIVPRLKAHGADLSRVFLFGGVPDGRGGTRLLDLPDDIALLEHKVIQREAALLILDPVLTMLGGDANKDQDARKALAPIKDMAERTGVAVICVRHLNKNISLSAIQRGGGNMGLIGVARAGAFFAQHPDDERLRVMAAHKSNLAEKPPSLSYRVVTSAANGAARVEWMGATNHDANSLASAPTSAAEKSKQDEAKEFLRDELSDGPMWAKQVQMDARDAGISSGTLANAKAALRVRSEKIGTEGWQWSLPDKEGDKDEDTKTEDPSHLSGLYGLYHLQNPGNGAAPHSAYVYEGNKDDKGTKGGKGSKEDPKKLIPLVAGAFDQAGSGAARNLPVYLDGTTTLAVLTNSVRSAMGLGYSPEEFPEEERRYWERVVSAVAEERRNGNGGEE